MRKIALFQIMALLITSLSAQTVKELKTLNQTVSKNGIIHQQSGEYVKSVKKTDGETWVKDSTYYYYANGDDWELYSKSVFEQRDEYGNPVVEKTYLYDATKDLWEPNDSIYRKWSALDIPAEYVSFAWNSSEQTWSDTTRYTKYNDNGQILSKTSRSWDYDRDAYNAFSFQQSKYTYDTNNLLIEEIIFSETRTGESWIKHLYQYDENGNIIEDLCLSLDDGNWNNSYRDTYTYNENGLWNKNNHFLWDDTDSVWFLFFETNYEYDENRNNTIIETKKYNFIDSTYILNSKTESLFDSNNNRTKRTKSSWDGASWTVSNESNYSYNENQLLENVTYSRYNNYTETLEKSSYTENFWSPFTNEGSTINEPQEINISLSPNPVTTLLKIITKDALISTIDIYSMQGQLIKRILPEKSLTIDCSGFKEGIFFVKFTTSQGSVTKKIVKN